MQNDENDQDRFVRASAFLIHSAFVILHSSFLDPVSVADFLGARALPMHAGGGGGGFGLRAEVGDDLHQLGVGDGLLLIGERDHPPVETIQLEA